MRRQRHAAVVSGRITPHLIVHVITPQLPNDRLDEVLGQGNPPKQLFRVVVDPTRRRGRVGARRARGGAGWAASGPQELADVVDVGPGRGPVAREAKVGDEEALADDALDLPVGEEEHDAVEVECFAHELLAVLVQQHGLERLVDVAAVLQIVDEPEIGGIWEG